MSERVPGSAREAARRRAVGALRSGQVVAVPTDTVYGLVADAFNPSAVARLRRVKKRTREHPFTVLLRSPRQVTGLVSDIPEAADRLMSSYWPGPLTIVLPVADGLGWDIGDNLGSVSLRMPTNDLLLGVVAEVGPLVCTAANLPGAAAATTVDEAEAAFGDGVGLYVDDGICDGAVSTVVDATTGTATVLREGAVPADHVLQVAAGELDWGARPGAAPATGLNDDAAAPGEPPAPDRNGQEEP